MRSCSGHSGGAVGEGRRRGSPFHREQRGMAGFSFPVIFAFPSHVVRLVSSFKTDLLHSKEHLWIKDY